jgi:type III secretion protein O
VQDIIGQVVDVKLLCESRAQEELRRQRYALEEAAREVERRRREATDYHAWRLGEESRLYGDIEGKLVRLADLEDLKAEIGLLRSRELSLQQAIEAAEALRARAGETVKAATHALEQATRARQKFEELAQMVEAEAQLLRDRAEEIELEEQFRLEPAGPDEAAA